MIDPKEYPALEALQSLHIPYKRYEHPQALTMEDCAHIGEDVGARHCKNLFLTNRQGTAFYLLLICGEKKFKTKDVSRALGVSRLSFCTAGQLMDKLGLLPGSVTPLGLLNDPAGAVEVVVDADVARFPMLCVHPLVSTASLALSGEDMLRFLRSRKNPLHIIKIESTEEE